MNMKYRSRTDITAQILEAANGGVTKTKIMYKAFLSYAQLKEYLTVLIENGLLEYIEGEQIYRTTEKGNRFLKIYNQIGEYVAADMSDPPTEADIWKVGDHIQNGMTLEYILTSRGELNSRESALVSMNLGQAGENWNVRFTI